MQKQRSKTCEKEIEKKYTVGTFKQVRNASESSQEEGRFLNL
jgi:hypothetical protein